MQAIHTLDHNIEKGFRKYRLLVLSISIPILLVIGGLIIYQLFHPTGTRAAWFDENWLYRKAIPISAHTAAENNVYINLTGANALDTQTLITAGKMLSNCADMRFTKQNGETLPYYIVSGCNTTSTVVHVFFNTFPAGAQTIYFYYGNSSALAGGKSADFATEASNYTFGTLASEEQSAGPVGYWSFDEGQGTLAQDKSSSRNNGTLSGTTKPAWTTEDQCIAGKCLYFDGSTSYVDMGDPSTGSLDFGTGDFTLSLWVKPEANTAILLSKGDNSSGDVPAGSKSGYNLYLDSTAHLFGGISSYDTNQKYSYFTATNAISLNTWNHIEFSKTGTTELAIYVNGVKQAGTYGGNPLSEIGSISTDASFRIGTYTPLSAYTKGFIDEPKIYPYARTATQVKADYLAGKANAESKSGTGAALGSKGSIAFSDGLVGYWKMDESSGNAADSSGNSLTLTNNSSMAYAAGKFGNAAQGDGTADYLNTATAINGIKTVSFWAYTPDTTNYFINLINSSAYITSSSGTFTATGFTAPSIYVNGVLNGTLSANTWTFVTITTNTAINANAFAVGLTNDGSSHYYTNTSKIDEVRVYNRVLTSAEISSLYNWAPGPVGYWNFEEGTGGAVNDKSGYGYNGSWAGTGTTHWVTGKYGKAGKFNGSDDVVTTVNNTTVKPTNGTVMAWIKTSGAGSSYRGIVVNNTNYGIFLKDNVFMTYDWGASADRSSGVSLNDGNWHHVAMTFQSGVTNGTQLWVDGISKLTTTMTIGGSVSDVLRIGSNQDTQYFAGQIDEAKVYNYARTQKQIIADMLGSPKLVSSEGGNAGQGAVAYYKFDEGTDNTCSGGVNDTCNSGSAGSALDGAQSGMAVPATSTSGWSQSGKFSKALTFDGSDDFVTIADNSALTPADITVSFWFKAAALPTSGNIMGLVGKWDASDASNGYTTELYNNGSSTKIYYFAGNNGGCTSGNTVFSTGTWYHFTAVQSGTTATCFVNGVSVNSGTTPALTNLATALLFGKRADGKLYNGLLDEIKIYNYALTADEVKTEYNHGSSLQLGALGTNSTYEKGAANQEYCIPGDATSCATPVGRWDFEEGGSLGVGTTAYDSSGSSYAGIWKGTGSHPTIGKVGKGGKFNGSDDYVEATLASVSTETMEAWVKLSAYPSAGKVFGVVAHSQGNNATGAFDKIIYVDENGKAGFYVWDGAVRTTLGTTTLQLNNWYHLTGVIGSSGLQIFVNGRQENINAAITTSWTSGTKVDISFNATEGGETSLAADHFNGSIDNVRIYNYQRSAAQVAYDYNRGGPVGWWKMDECQGTTIHDSSGNNNSGTITVATGNPLGTCTTANSFWGGSSGTGAGKRNYAPTFDGTDDYVAVPHNANQINLPISVSVWAKSGTVSQGEWKAVVSKYVGGSWNGWNIDSSSGSYYFYYLADHTNYLFTGSYGYSFGAATTSWTHLVATVDSTGVKLYRDGKLVTTGSWAGTPTACTQTSELRFGRITAGDPAFQGQIDDVRIYNYALTNQQVKDIMNEGAVRFGPVTGSP